MPGHKLKTITMISPQEIKRYLDMSRDIGRRFKCCDIHTHPFEIIAGDLDYRQCSHDPELYRRNQTNFTPPEISNRCPEIKCQLEKIPDSETLNCVSLMMLKRRFVHTGPKVFKAHMDISGISRSLLLPVAPPAGDIEEQMRAMSGMFGSDNRFALATSVPNTTPEDEIDSFIENMIVQYNIKAVKLHPNISGINPASTKGQTRIESILWACGKNRIPLIIHGGRSGLLKNANASSYACIDNFKDINWSADGATVIIAHAGFNLHSRNQIETDILPKIKKILNTNDNVMVDISNLGVNELILVFRNIETEKILFGTDALYNNQWSSIVKAMFALSKADYQVDRTFAKIASVNPLKYIFEED